jgi:hypothetical protein
MGRWLDNEKFLRRPKYITIHPKENGEKLEVVLQYSSPLKNVTKELDSVHISFEGTNCNINLAEEWGDWGGPIKVGDVLQITPPIKLEILKEKKK